MRFYHNCIVLGRGNNMNSTIVTIFAYCASKSGGEASYPGGSPILVLLGLLRAIIQSTLAKPLYLSLMT